MRQPGLGRDLAQILDVVDVFIDNTNVAARAGNDAVFCLTRDLLTAARDMALGRKVKTTVSFYEGPWELVLLREGDLVLVTFLRAGTAPEVVVQDSVTSLETVGASAVLAAEKLLRSARRHDTSLLRDPLAEEMELLCAEVRGALLAPKQLDLLERPEPVMTRSALYSGGAPEGRLGLAFELTATSRDLLGPVQRGRADLHGLLAQGSLVALASGRRWVVGRGRVFLQVERLLAAFRHLLGAWERGRPMHVRLHGDTLQVSLRLNEDERVALSLGQVGASAGTAVALRDLEVGELARPLFAVAREFEGAVTQLAPAQADNPRFESFCRELDAIETWYRDLTREPLVDESAEPYEVADADEEELDRASTQVHLAAARRLSYHERWWLEAEGLDLDGTFLCGDRIVATARDTVMALDRDRGELLWRIPATPAFSLMAGHYGLVRLTPTGAASLVDLRDGRERWSCELRPRAGRAAGLLVGGGRGPRAAVLAEAERSLVALDLNTGEQRWRFAAWRGRDFSLRKAGRLLLVTCGDSSVYAIDAESGEVTWRLTARATFEQPAVPVSDSVIACDGPAGGPDGRVFCADLASGRLRWARSLDLGVAGPAVGAASRVAVVPCRDEERGAALVGLDLDSGEERWRTWLDGWGAFALLAVDDGIVACGAGGRLAAVAGRTGEHQWSQIFEREANDDVPRRLEPVLRGGALFVPADTVYVVSPRDGSVIHRLRGDGLVPDLLRVDERAGIYVAEESGYLAAYGVAARLAVIK